MEGQPPGSRTVLLRTWEFLLVPIRPAESPESLRSNGSREAIRKPSGRRTKLRPKPLMTKLSSS